MDLELLKALTAATGTPGHEGPVRAVLREYLQGSVDELRTDAMGNLFARKGSGPLVVLLDAHMDEVGLIITGYTDDGLLRFKKSGGIDDRVLAGKSFWVGPLRLPGVVGLKAYHLTEEREKAVSYRELYLDIGARNRDEAMALVDYGHPAVWATELEEWGEHTVKAKALDDRAGCALLAETLRTWPAHPALTVYGTFTVQEEIGTRGARTAAWQVSPHVALVYECTSSANVPGVSPEDIVTELGQGPALYWMDGLTIPPERLNRHLTELARGAGLPLQYRRQTTAGTNAGAVHLSRGGVPTANLALPCRYFHSGTSLIDRADYAAALALSARFLDSLAKGEFRP